MLKYIKRRTLMASRIFEHIQPDFFRILSVKNKFEYAECLGLLYEEVSDSNDYSIARSDASQILTNYFEEIRFDDNETLVQSSRDRATYFLRELRDCGWIEENFNQNNILTLTLSDVAVQFLSFIEGLKYDTEIKYSSQIYSIYQSLDNFDRNRGELIIEDVYLKTEAFFDSLRRLNGNIRKYSQKIFDDNIANDVKGLLKIITDEYQIKVVDAAYYHLLTKDHPSQYSHKIIQSIDEIIGDHSFVLEMALRMSEDSETEVINYRMLQSKLFTIKERFSSIKDIISDIDDKNKRFVSSAIGRISFILNESTDITGVINSLIMELIETPDFEYDGLLVDIKTLEEKSLATPRKRIIKESSFIETAEIDEKQLELMQNRFIEISKYSKVRIDQIVMDLLGKHESVEIDESHDIDITMRTLIYLYSFASDAKYEAKVSHQSELIDGKIVGKMNIRRKIYG